MIKRYLENNLSKRNVKVLNEACEKLNVSRFDMFNKYIKPFYHGSRTVKIYTKETTLNYDDIRVHHIKDVYVKPSIRKQEIFNELSYKAMENGCYFFGIQTYNSQTFIFATYKLSKTNNDKRFDVEYIYTPTYLYIIFYTQDFE